MVKNPLIIKNENLRVSIVTVVLNNVHTIEQTILSVVNQTYSNIEYIIIDGGSVDGTLEIIEKYKKNIDILICEKDKGLYDAMNKGVSLANGEIIGIINSDDWYESNAVKLVVNAFHNNPKKQIFHGDRYDIDDGGKKKIRKYNSSEFKFIYYGMTYNHPSMFFHKNIYKENRYNISLSSLADYEFVLNQYLKNKKLFHYIPKAYVNYRLTGVSSRLSLKKSLYEGYIARKNNRLNFFIIFVAVFFRLIFFVLYKFRFFKII